MSASITSGTYPRASRSAPGGSTAPLRRAVGKVWAIQVGLGEQRGRRHLLRLADKYQFSDPALARSLRESARHLGEVLTSRAAERSRREPGPDLSAVAAR